MKLIKTCLLFLKVKPTKNWKLSLFGPSLLFEIGAFQLVNHTWPWKKHLMQHLECLPENHVIHRSYYLWSGLSADLVIEEVLICILKK